MSTTATSPPPTAGAAPRSTHQPVAPVAAPAQRPATLEPCAGDQSVDHPPARVELVGSQTIAGFVDYGYLRAEGARVLGISRRAARTDAGAVLEFIRACSSPEGVRERFLRAYWYDGAFDVRDPRRAQQERFFAAIAAHEGVQLRLGHLKEFAPGWHPLLEEALEAVGVDRARFAEHFELRPELRQKGVDTLITLDLVRLAQQRAINTALLIAGDRDLAEVVRTVQDSGVRVVIATPSAHSVSREMRALADQLLEIPEATLTQMLCRPDAR